MTACYLVKDDHTPSRAKFPVIDAHNHLWAEWGSVDRVREVMDQVGVRTYCDLTANISVRWGEGGYKLGSGSLESFLHHCVKPHGDRFYGFTCANFIGPPEQPLFGDAGVFAEENVAVLRDHVRQGARGLKILKEVGLRYRDAKGDLVRLDDERLAPIWDACAELGVPVLMHVSDPYGFFQPVTPENEHYDSLQKYPDWSFADPVFPGKERLLEQRNRLLSSHPGTTFMLPHVANFPEDLTGVSKLLDDFPNAFIDFSARIDELGRQPYTAREFLIQYRDRIYFGTDMPASAEMYRCYFRFLETWDEYFIPPDYDGTFGRYRWRIHGLGLPDDVLQDIYFRTVQRLVPGLPRI